MFLLALAISFSLNSLDARSSSLINKVVYCSYNESPCSCGISCDNSNILSAETENTIDGCNDGSEVNIGKSFVEYYEFVSDIRVTNLNASIDGNYNGGNFVKVDATLLCSIDGDTYFIFYKNSTDNNVSWKLIDSSTCISNDSITYLSQLKNVSTIFKLDYKNSNQSIRVIVTFQTSPQNDSCGLDHDSMYSDTDDIVFGVLDNHDLDPPLINIISPVSNSVFESKDENKTLDIIANITDTTGIDNAYVNISYSDYISLSNNSETKLLENTGDLYQSNITLPNHFVGRVFIKFYANDTVSIESGSPVPNNVNDYTASTVYFRDDVKINITSPQMLSLKNETTQLISATIFEDNSIHNSTLKSMDAGNASVNLNSTGITIVDENTTIYALNYTFSEGENTFYICIKNITTNSSIECSFNVFTVDLTAPDVTSNLIPVYRNNETISFIVNISDSVTKVLDWSISIVNSNNTELFFANNTSNEKENLIGVVKDISVLGNYSVLVHAVDSAYNTNNATFLFSVADAKSPNISFIYSPNDSKSLDPNKTISFSVSVSDQSLIKSTIFTVVKDNIEIYSTNLSYSIQENAGEFFVYNYSLNFTPDSEGIYSFNITSVDDAFNSVTRLFDINESYEVAYVSGLEYSSNITNIGKDSLVNYYWINNTGDLPINITLISQTVLESYLSDAHPHILPGEQNKVGIFAKSGDYVNEYTIGVMASCTSKNCINTDTNISNKSDSFVLYVTNDYAFLTLEDNIDSTIYEETTKENLLSVRNIGKSNASDVNINIILDSSLLNVSDNSFIIDSLSGLNGMNNFSFKFNMTAFKINSDINTSLIYSINYNNSVEIIYKNITKDISLKQAPVRIREVRSSGGKSSAGFGGSVFSSVPVINSSKEITFNISNKSDNGYVGLPDNASNLSINESPDLSREKIDSGSINKDESGLLGEKNVDSINDGVNTIDNSKLTNNDNSQKNNLLTGYDIAETKLKLLSTNREFLRKAGSFMFLGAVLYLTLIQVVIRASRRY